MGVHRHAAGARGDSGREPLSQRDEGLRLLAAALARVAQEHAVARPDPLVRDVYDAWLLVQERERLLKPSTLDVCAQARQRLWPHLDGVRASHMGAALAEDLLAALLKDGLRESTARARLAKLRAAWGWAYDRGMVSTPWRQPRRQRARRNRSAPKRAFTVAELATVLNRLTPHYRLPVQVLAETGCRPGELMAADCADLEGGWLRVVTGKAGGLERLLPLRPATAKALAAHARGRRGALFVGERDGRRMRTRTLGNKVAQACEDMRRRIGPDTRGASYDLDCYSLRRSWIDHAARAGVDEVVARTVVGHSVQGVHHGYRRGSVTREQMRGAVDRVAEWRAAEYSAQMQLPEAVPSRRWTSSGQSRQGLRGPALSLDRAESLHALGAATRTLPADAAQAVSLLTARAAVKRAAVRLAGLRGFVLHAQPEVFSVT